MRILTYKVIQITAFFAALLLPFSLITADVKIDLKTRCQSALKLDMNELQNQQAVVSLIKEIRQKKQRYLKSRMYPEIRQLYEKLQVKLGDHFYQRNNFGKALSYYVEADKYAVRGYRNKIHKCQENITKTIMQEIAQGNNNAYQKFIRDAGNELKIYFWQYFYAEIKKLDNQGKIEDILVYTGFWQHLKQNRLTDSSNSTLNVQRREVDRIFTLTLHQYKQQLNKRMSLLEPVNSAPQEILRYTGDNEFAKRIEKYAVDYNAFRELMPPEQEEVEKAEALLERMDNGISIDDEIKIKLKSYLENWKEYYHVGRGDSYVQKRAAFHKKGEKLTQIKQITNSLKVLDLKAHTRKLDEMIDQAEADETKWRMHMEMETIIDNFEKKENPTLDELYKIRKAIFYAPEGAAFEGPLLERVNRFLNIPSQQQLNLKRLEHYFETNRNLDSNIAKVLKGEFEKILLARLNDLIRKNRWSPKDRDTIKRYIAKYEAYFGKKPPGFSSRPQNGSGEKTGKKVEQKQSKKD